MRQRGSLKLRHNTWSLQLRSKDADGIVRWKSIRLGSKTEFPTKSAARRAADRYLDHADPKELNPGETMSWSKWCDRYIDYHLGNQARGTRATKGSIIEAHLRHAFEGPVHKIDLTRIRDFIVDQRKSGAAAATIDARFRTLRRMLRVAAEEGLAVTPPTLQQLDLPTNDTISQAVLQKAFTHAEFLQILGHSITSDATAYALGRYAGLRGSEICGLSWDLINLDTGAITVRQQALDGVLRPLKTKGSAQVLQAPPELLKQLRLYRETWGAFPNPGGFLFADAAGRPETSQALRERLHVTLESQGIRRRGLHGFRHLCAIAMAEAGVNPETIRRAMRHSSLRITALYLTVSPEDISAGLATGAGGLNIRTLEDGAPAGY